MLGVTTGSTMESAAHASLEGAVWLLIILGSIIAQVVKANKQAKERAEANRRIAAGETPPQREDDAPAWASPDEELRRFLNNLGVSSREEAPPPVPPPAPAARTSYTHADASMAAPKRPEVERTAPAKQPRKPRPAPRRRKPPQADVILSKPKPALGADDPLGLLRNRAGLRRAIVMNEILGPPLALQRVRRVSEATRF